MGESLKESLKRISEDETAGGTLRGMPEELEKILYEIFIKVLGDSLKEILEESLKALLKESLKPVLDLEKFVKELSERNY